MILLLIILLICIYSDKYVKNPKIQQLKNVVMIYKPNN